MDEQLFSSIFNLSPQMIAITSQKDGTIIMANPVFTEALGFSQEEYTNKSTIELNIWPNPEVRNSIVTEVSAKGLVRNKEVTLRTKYGKLINCHFSATPMTYNSQDCLVVIVSDITEQKQVEQAFHNSEFRFRSIVENLPIGVSIGDLNGNIQYLNPAFYNYFGYTLNDIPNIETWAKLAYPDSNYRQQSINTWRSDIAEIKEGKTTFSKPRVYHINSKHNQVLDVEIIFTFFDNDIYTIFTNVSEKLKAENELRASEQKFINIFNLSPDMVGITRISDGTVINGNAELTNLTGFSRNEYIGQTTKELGWWANYNDRAAMLKLLKEKGEVKNLEINMRIKDGTILTCLFSCNKVNIDNEDCLLFVVHDITERKQAEELLKKSEERLQKAQEIGRIGYSEQFFGEKQVWLSAQGMRMYGFEPVDGYIPVEKLLACIQGFDKIRSKVRELIKQKKRINLELTVNPSNGASQRIIHSITEIEADSQGSSIKGVSIFQDITERKKAEAALRESESRLQSFIDSSSDGVMIINEHGLIEEFNPSAVAITGIPRKEAINQKWENIAKLAYPTEWQTNDNQWQLEQIINSALRSGEIPRTRKEYNIKHRNGEQKCVEQKFFIIKTGKKYRIAAILTDITEHKKMEEALRDSEEKYRTLVENMQDAVYRCALDGTVTYTTPSAARLLGYPSEKDMIGINVLDFYFRPEDAQNQSKILEEQGFIKHYEVILKRKDTGNPIIVNVNTQFHKDKNGNVVGIEGVYHDITERKHAEEQLIINENRLKKAQLIGQIGYTEQFINSPDVWASAEGMRIFGFPPFEGSVPFEKVKACIENYALFQKSYYELVQNGKKFDIEFAINPADGSSQRYIHEIVDVELDSNGKPYKLLGIFQDITKRKKAEEALQKRLIALTKPLDDPEGVKITDLFNVEELQEVQDAFADATGVASIITLPDGTPITNTSRFCRLCNMIRGTEKGRINCYKSDSIIGKQNINGPIIQSCYSGGLWDAGAGITIGGKHIANWLIGQIRNKNQDENKIINYAHEIGLNPEDFRQALQEVPSMSEDQFGKVAKALFILANQLSIKAYQNIQQARFIAEQKQAEEALRESERNYRDVFNATSDAMFVHEMPSGKVIDVNNAMLQMYGYDTKEEVLSFKTQSFIVNKPPYTLDKAMEMLRMANEVGPQTFEWMIQHNKTKELRWAEVSLTRSDIGGANRILASVRDITERRNAEELLKKSEAILKATMESMIDGVLVVSSDGKITNWNTRFCEIFNIQNDLITTQNDQLLLNFAKKQLVDPESFHRQVEAIYKTNRPTEDTLYFTNGRIVERVSFPLSEDSPIDGRVWLFRDITERKKAEEALQQSQTLLKESQRVARIGNWEYYYKENKLIWSEEAFNIFGYNYQEIDLSFETFLELVNPTERDFVKQHLQKSIRQKEFKNYECSITLQNGEQRYIYVIGEVSTNNNNEAYRSFGIIQDITERKKNEAILQEKEAKIRSIFTAAPVGIALVVNKVFHECNDAFYSITGYSTEEIIGKSTRMLYATEDDFILTGEVPIPDIKETGLESFETVWQKKDGKFISILLNYIAIDPNDSTKGLIFTVLDITERKQAELEIKRINAKLEERVLQRTAQLEKANKDLEAFAYSVSHDLRAPLRHVDGFMRLMYSNIPSPTKTVNDYYEKINLASKRMSSMIDDLLSFSRLGRKEILKTDVNMNTLISEVIDHYKQETSTRSIEWKIQSLPQVYADRNLLRLAFENLISNAIKYSSTNPLAVIEIGTALSADNREEIFVKDNGVGFDMAYSDKLFGVFQRLHSIEEFEGTGIGLANVKQIIDKHGGTVRAEGKINEGAIFFVYLPK